MKVARWVWSRGKDGDYIKVLPIAIKQTSSLNKEITCNKWRITMKNLFLVSLMIVLVASTLFGCSLSNEHESKTSSCKTPPKTIELEGKTYNLEEENTSVEPVIKMGYMVCEDGSFSLSNDPNSAVTIYSGSAPNDNNIVVYGDWDDGVLCHTDDNANE